MDGASCDLNWFALSVVEVHQGSSPVVNSFHCFNDIYGDSKVIHSLEQLVIVHRITGR